MSEYDKELVLEILSQIHQSAQKILKRFEPIKSAEDFTRRPDHLGPDSAIYLIESCIYIFFK